MTPWMLFAGILLACLAVVVRWILIAPAGHQDDNGFHLDADDGGS